MVRAGHVGVAVTHDCILRYRRLQLSKLGRGQLHRQGAEVLLQPCRALGACRQGRTPGRIDITAGSWESSADGRSRQALGHGSLQAGAGQALASDSGGCAHALPGTPSACCALLLAVQSPPGMGTTSSPCASSQASASCARVQPLRCAIAATLSASACMQRCGQKDADGSAVLGAARLSLPCSLPVCCRSGIFAWNTCCRDLVCQGLPSLHPCAAGSVAVRQTSSPNNKPKQVSCLVGLEGLSLEARLPPAPKVLLPQLLGAGEAPRLRRRGGQGGGEGVGGA